MNRELVGWVWLALGLVAALLFIVSLHQVSPRMTGAVGDLIDRNRNQGIEVTAYFYSEVDDPSQFLDEERGRYGRRALLQHLEGQGCPRGRAAENHGF